MLDELCGGAKKRSGEASVRGSGINGGISSPGR